MSKEEMSQEPQSTEEELQNSGDGSTAEEVKDEENNSVEETSAEDNQENFSKELEVMKEKYARMHADFENIKKRLEREKYQALEYANEKFAKDLIPVLDALGMAIEAKNVESSDAAELLHKVVEGVELTMKQFLSVLEKHGVTPVGEEEPFDPNIHHAVQQVDSDDVESGQIVQTFQKGYRYKERTLRDAMVVVAN